MVLQEGDSRYSTYLTHRAALVDYAAPILGSRADAEDIVQEAFIRFVPQNAAPAVAVKSYLFRIVRNLALDMRRRRQLEMRQHPDDLPHWTMPQAVQTPEEHALFCDAAKRISAYLAALPRQNRIAVEMHRFGGYRMEEIAAYLGVSVATVHRMLRKAIAEISELLDHSG